MTFAADIAADIAADLTATFRTTKAPPKDTSPADLNLDDWKPDFAQFRTELEAELRDAFLAAFRSSALPGARGQMNELATQYALERSGELIGGKYDLAESTLQQLRAMVAQAVENGLSIGQLKAGLANELAFGAGRAQLIAVTETAFALGQGQRGAALAMGQDQKSWVTSGDEGVCEECDANESDGWIDVDESFSDGSDTIPSHPGCRCDCNYRTRSVHEANVAPAVAKEAKCPKCRRWLGRNVNVGAEIYCPEHKAVRIEA